MKKSKKAHEEKEDDAQERFELSYWLETRPQGP